MKVFCPRELSLTKLTVTFMTIWMAILTSRASEVITNDPEGNESDRVPDSQMVWGATTNLEVRAPFDLVPVSFKAGIRSSNGIIVFSRNPPKLLTPVSVYLENVHGRPIWTTPATTNNGVVSHDIEKGEYVGFIFLPPESERLAIVMTNVDGVAMPKTQAGLNLTLPKLGGKKWGHWDKDGRQDLALLSHADNELYFFDPTKYFVIEKAGMYKLRLVQHLYVIGANRLLEPLSLPPVTVDIKVEP
jgi:hypothetical protein